MAGKDLLAVAKPIAAVSDKRNQGFVRQIVHGQEGPDHRGHGLSPNRKANKDCVVVRQIRSPGLQSWPKATVAFLPSLRDRFQIVLGIRCGMPDLEQSRAPRAINKPGDDPRVAGPGKVGNQSSRTAPCRSPCGAALGVGCGSATGGKRSEGRSRRGRSLHGGRATKHHSLSAHLYQRLTGPNTV